MSTYPRPNKYISAAIALVAATPRKLISGKMPVIEIDMRRERRELRTKVID